MSSEQSVISKLQVNNSENKDSKIITIKSHKISSSSATFKVSSIKFPTKRSFNNFSNNLSNQKTATKIRATSLNVATRVLNTASTTGSTEQIQDAKREKGGADRVIEINMKSLKVLYAITIIVGILLVVAMACWICMYLDGGLKEFKFNWHPLLMTIGFVFLNGNAILVYRGSRHSKKQNLKAAHAILHFIVMIVAAIGLVAVFRTSKNHLFSLHSWLGVAALVLFFFQYLAGFMAYALPIMRDYYRMSYMPIHTFFGSFTFVLGIITALLGLFEKTIHDFKDKYPKFETAALVANLCGVLFVVFGALVLFVVSYPLYKRIPRTLDYFAELVNQYLEDRFTRMR